VLLHRLENLSTHVILSEAKDLVFRIHGVLCPNNEILRRFAPQNDTTLPVILLQTQVDFIFNLAAWLSYITAIHPGARAAEERESNLDDAPMLP
jgi:hypothetical protein